MAGDVANLEPYQFGKPGIRIPFGSHKQGKHWSVRAAIDRIASLEFDAEEEITFSTIKRKLAQHTHNGRVLGGMLIACRRFSRALDGDVVSLQAVTEDIDGKLKDVIEHQVKPLELTDDERAERMAMILAHAQKRIADQPLSTGSVVDSIDAEATIIE